jgi:ethanolamine ammonia-lyase small subunit
MKDGDTSLACSSPAIAARLRELTPARVGLGRIGVSLQTRDVLAFQLCHAQARDAVYARFDPVSLAAAIAPIVLRTHAASVIRLHSAAPDRATYLQRPDLGRKLDESAQQAVASVAAGLFDLVLIVVDGLSALAVERHVPPLLNELFPRLADWKIAPVCVVEQGRVAIGDEIGAALHAEMSLVLIGERPGLSSPDSLGAYITWRPRPGRTDAERNCISNIRVDGLGYRDAADQLMYCLATARRRQLTGATLFTGAARSSEPHQLRDAGDNGGNK